MRVGVTFEDLFHGHRSSEDTSLSFDNTFNKLMDVVGSISVRRNKPSVQNQRFRVVHARSDGEDGGENERELLSAHGLDFESVVDRRNVEDGARLPWKHP